MSPEKRGKTSSLPEFSQAVEEGPLELGQFQWDVAGRSGVPPGVSGLSTQAAAPTSSSTASLTVPLSTNDDEENNSIIGRLNDGLQLPAVKTPLKRGLKKTLPITPEASTSSTSTGGSSVPLRWHPSPAKRWKHATEVATKPLSPVKTLDNQIQELREVIQHGPAELMVGCTKYQYFRTSLTVFFLIHKLRAKGLFLSGSRNHLTQGVLW